MAPDHLHPTLAAALAERLPLLHWTHYPERQVQREGEPCIKCGYPEPQRLDVPCEGCEAILEMLDATRRPPCARCDEDGSDPDSLCDDCRERREVRLTDRAREMMQ